MGNLRMNADQISYKGGNTPMTVEEALKNSAGEAAVIEQLQQDVSDLNGNKANKADIATEFSDLTNYNAGDLVYYDGALYEFQVDHSAGVWETSEVIQKDLSDIVTMLKSGLTRVSSRLVSMFTSYDASSNVFPIPDTSKPYEGQVVCAGRNLSTGAIYLLWYDSGSHGFRVGVTVSGNAPSNGESVTIQYFS